MIKKKRFTLISMILVILCLPGCKKSSVISDPGDGNNGYIQSTASLDLDNGQQMRYTLAVPGSYTQGQPIPLVVGLHYGGRYSWIGEEFLNNLVLPALKDLNAIFVAPVVPGETWIDSLSQQAVLKLVEELKKQYTIDPGRIMVTGFSLGGIGTWHYAAVFPQIFALGIPIAGRPGDQALSQYGFTPIFVIHGREDEYIPIDAIEEIVNRLKAEGKPVEAKFIDGLGHSDVAAYVEHLAGTIGWIQSNW